MIKSLAYNEQRDILCLIYRQVIFLVYEPTRKCKIAYVKALNNENETFFDKVKYWIKCNCGMINVKKAESNVICEIPINNKKIVDKKVNMIINKLNSEIKKESIEALVFSDNVKHILNPICGKKLKNVIEIPIVNGKFLMKNLLVDILERISELRNQDISMLKVHILVEKYNKENLDILYDIAGKVKNINIVTANIKNFKKVEEKLFNNAGFAISVGNNRKKGMKRAEIIINFDFDSETVKKYNINRDSVIINCNDDILDMANGFSGVIINGVKIGENMEVLEYFKMYDILKNFDITELYESLLFNKFYDKITRQKNKDKIFISEFLGSRGIINIKELECNNQVKIGSNK